MKTIWWLLLLASLPLASYAQAPSKPATGPAVGTRVPEFKAMDQNGHPQTMSSLSGPKGSLLVFIRSADW